MKKNEIVLNFVCVGVTSFLVDVCFPYILSTGLIRESILVRCLADSFAHGIISVVVWARTSHRGIFANRYSLILSYLCSVLLDVDHFIAAGSVTLKAATR